MKTRVVMSHLNVMLRYHKLTWNILSCDEILGGIECRGKWYGGNIGIGSSFAGTLCGHKGIEGYQERECGFQEVVCNQ